VNTSLKWMVCVTSERVSPTYSASRLVQRVALVVSR